MRSSTALWLFASLFPSPAAADVPGPNDELCTVEVQQRDGSHCEACMVSMQDRAGNANPCEALESRGLRRRCSIGATHSTTIYCDAEANWLEVGGGGGCGCRAAGGSPRWGWPIAALAALLWRWRRPRGGVRARRARGTPDARRSAGESR